MPGSTGGRNGAPLLLEPPATRVAPAARTSPLKSHVALKHLKVAPPPQSYTITESDGSYLVPPLQCGHMPRILTPGLSLEAGQAMPSIFRRADRVLLSRSWAEAVAAAPCGAGADDAVGSEPLLPLAAPSLDWVAEDGGDGMRQ